MIPETIPEMKARYERQIADLQGQIDRLTLDLHYANEARERTESELANLRALIATRDELQRLISEPMDETAEEMADRLLADFEKRLAKATTP